MLASELLRRLVPDPADANGLIAAGNLQLFGGTKGQYAGVLNLTAEIDLLAAAATYVIVPPVALRLVRSLTQWQITAKSGAAITVGPTSSIGTNSASFNNVFSSHVDAGFTTQAVDTAVSYGGVVVPVPLPDLTANGLVLNVTNPATGGVGSVLRARIQVLAFLVPL